MTIRTRLPKLPKQEEQADSMHKVVRAMQAFQRSEEQVRKAERAYHNALNKMHFKRHELLGAQRELLEYLTGERYSANMESQ